VAYPGGARRDDRDGVRGACLERVLAPSSRAGQAMRDSPSTHKKDEEASGLTEARGREVLFLPPYSPGYNPI